MLRYRAEKLLTRLSAILNLSEDLTAPKSLKLEPWGGILLLSPDGAWQIFMPGEWLQPKTDAVICWQPEQWAKWVQGALAGWWSFSLKDGVSIDGDVTWVMGLYQRLQLLPWWYAHQRQTQQGHSVFSLLHRLGQKALDDAKTLLDASAALIEDGLKESQLGFSRSLMMGAWSSQITLLHEAVERLEARFIQLENITTYRAEHHENTKSSHVKHTAVSLVR